MVVVTNDGKCRTYFLPSISKLDKSRVGINYEIIKEDELSTGHRTTQTTETVAVPDRSNSSKGIITHQTEKVKQESEENMEKTRQMLSSVAKNVSLDIKKSDVKTANEFASVLKDRVTRFKIPEFDSISTEKTRNAVGGVIDNEFRVSLSILKNAEKKWERDLKDAEKNDGHLWTFYTGPEDFIRSFVDHEIGHKILDRSGKIGLVADVFSRAGVAHSRLGSARPTGEKSRHWPTRIRWPT